MVKLNLSFCLQWVVKITFSKNLENYHNQAGFTTVYLFWEFFVFFFETLMLVEVILSLQKPPELTQTNMVLKTKKTWRVAATGTDTVPSEDLTFSNLDPEEKRLFFKLCKQCSRAGTSAQDDWGSMSGLRSGTDLLWKMIWWLPTHWMLRNMNFIIKIPQKQYVQNVLLHEK